MAGGFCFENCCEEGGECNVILCLTVNGFGVAGVVVTAKSGATTIASGSTVIGPGGGCVLLNVGSAGTYTFEVAINAFDPNFTDCSQDFAVICDGTYTINFCQFVVSGCISDEPLAGATVSVAGYADQVTNALGGVYYNCIPVGSYAYTVTHPRFQTASGTWTAAAIQFIGVGSGFAGPATGYRCLADLCNLPIPESLDLTDSFLGAVTMTYNVGTGFWEGSKTINMAAYCGCIAKTGLIIKYRWPNAVGDYRISVSTRIVSGCPTTGVANTNILPNIGGTSEVCEPFEVIDQYDSGCGDPNFGPKFWQASGVTTLTLTE